MRRSFDAAAVRTRLLFPMAVAVMSVLAAGCTKEAIERATVSGVVNLDGQPIPNGQIRFVPTNGPTWSAWIKDGRYTTDGTKGVPVGQLQVWVEAYRIPAWYKPAGSVAIEDEVPREQYLPPRYNVQSELELVIEPGTGSIEKNFDLVSR
jgi:hypothetical protein